MKLTSAGSSAMASGGRECPFCHVPLVRIQSKQPVKGDPTTCGFIRSELEYEALEAQECRLETGKDASGDSYAELKEELQKVKQTLETVVAELWKLKVQPAEPKPGLNPELKPELDTRKLQLVLGSSVVAPVFVGFVGVLIGVVVAGRWK